MALNSSLSSLPDELLELILFDLPRESLYAVELASRRLREAVHNPRLWRRVCCTHWTRWHPRHDIHTKLRGPVNAVDWRKLALQRTDIDRKVNDLLKSLISSRQGRIPKAEAIIAEGNDAKDVILRNYNVPDDFEDVLAVRYYAEAILGGIHRAIAINELDQLRKGIDVPLENALGVFDMFVLGPEKGDLEDISALLDDLVNKVLHEHPEFEHLPVRQKAVAVADSLRVDTTSAWELPLRGKVLSMSAVLQGLYEDGHRPDRLISAAVYCCVAQRLSLDAVPCDLKSYVYVMVPLDHSEGSSAEFIIFNPVNLTSIDLTSNSYDQPPAALSTWQMVLRLAAALDSAISEEMRQISTTFQTNQEAISRITRLHSLTTYGTCWTRLLLNKAVEVLGSILRDIKLRNWMDVGQIEKHSRHLKDYEEGFMCQDLIRYVYAEDKKLQIRIRDETTTQVLFRVGQMVRYTGTTSDDGVIIGWTPGELRRRSARVKSRMVNKPIKLRMADEPDIMQEPCRYIIFWSTGCRTTVEQDMIEASPSLPNATLIRAAGEYFKRWDSQTRMFVSNIKEEYPDD